MEDSFKEAARLASDAFDLTMAGRLAEAEPLYAEALEVAERCNHYSRWEFHTQYGQLLDKLGNERGAEGQFRAAVDAALELSRGLVYPDEDAGISKERGAPNDLRPAVVVARFFLGEFLVSKGRHADALAAIGPSAAAKAGELSLVEAEALWALGRHDEARRAGGRAVSLALSEAQRAGFESRLAALPGWSLGD